MSRRLLMILAILAGIAFLLVGYVYLSRSAANLPAWFPGHEATVTKIHTKHGLAAIILGLGCFVFAWFQTGTKVTATSSTPPTR